MKAFSCGGFLIGSERGDVVESVTQGRWCARFLLEVASHLCVQHISWQSIQLYLLIPSYFLSPLT